jgi:DnaJ-class molecular chaperone
MSDLYNILGIEKSATQEEIKKAYQKLAKKNHPDSPDRDENRWDEISSAYAILNDPGRRKIYDETGIHNHNHNDLVSETTASVFMRHFGGQEPLKSAIRTIEQENLMNEMKIVQAKRDISSIDFILGRLSRNDSEKDPIKDALNIKKSELENMIKSATYVISLMKEVIGELKKYRLAPKITSTVDDDVILLLRSLRM